MQIYYLILGLGSYVAVILWTNGLSLLIFTLMVYIGCFKIPLSDEKVSILSKSSMQYKSVRGKDWVSNRNQKSNQQFSILEIQMASFFVLNEELSLLRTYSAIIVILHSTNICHCKGFQSHLQNEWQAELVRCSPSLIVSDIILLELERNVDYMKRFTYKLRTTHSWIMEGVKKNEEVQRAYECVEKALSLS